jgi:hypothetical protein
VLVELGLVEQRYQAVLEVLSGVTVTEVAGRFGVTFSVSAIPGHPGLRIVVLESARGGVEQDGDVLVDEFLGDRRHGGDRLGNLLGEARPHVALHELEEHRHELLGGVLEVREEELVVGHPPTVRRSGIGDAAYFQGTAPPRRW